MIRDGRRYRRDGGRGVSPWRMSPTRTLRWRSWRRRCASSAGSTPGQQCRRLDLREGGGHAAGGPAPPVRNQLLGLSDRLPHRRHPSGAVTAASLINLGSVLSDRAVPLQAAYCASKHGQGFHQRLSHGTGGGGRPVSVTLIKPGVHRHHVRRTCPQPDECRTAQSAAGPRARTGRPWHPA